MSEAIIRTNRDALRTAVDALLAAVDNDEHGSTDATREELVTAANDLMLAASGVRNAYRIHAERRSTEE